MRNVDLEKVTPMMRQYLETKKNYEDAILFYRLGDFYEMFFDDAITASKELDLALTGRGGGLDDKIPMCGIPHHVFKNYLSKLIDKGYKVAICDQVEDPKLAKGIVKREVTKVVTPGTFTDTDYIEAGSNNFMMSLYVRDNSVSITYVDYSTGMLLSTSKVFLNEGSRDEYIDLIVSKISPKEVVINSDGERYFDKSVLKNYINEKNIEEIKNKEYLKHLSSELKDELLNSKYRENISLEMLLNYLSNVSKTKLNHIVKIADINLEQKMILDENSMRNLEILKGLNSNRKSGSLLEVLDYTKTSMGQRLLRRWIEEPLLNLTDIKKRQDYVEEFKSDFILLDDVRSILSSIIDMERQMVKISDNEINPNEFNALKGSLESVMELKSYLEGSNFKNLNEISYELKPLYNIIEEIDSMIVEDAPVKTVDVKFIKDGYNEELDELFRLSKDGKKFLIDLEAKEKEETGIKNLKIKYNKILGYFIEVTKSALDMVPERYIRKQTLVGSERFFTIELKEMESKILNAHDEANSLQLKLYDNLIENFKKYTSLLLEVSEIVSRIDVLQGLAKSAIENRFIRPELNEDKTIIIKDGRHPIVEFKNRDDSFIPNDTILDMDKNLIHIITGPNMAGKSTYMRQIALIVIMAQIGSFVPAKSCNIGIVDRIFTRIGASDNLSKGESTFMVEMKEVANILKNATDKSLIILDEVGRGTSTFDGMSIAWSIVEYISENIGAKTVFATHYHELSKIEETYKNVSNLNIKVKKDGEEIIFLRKIVEGWTDNSYGIDVAKLAGIDEKVTKRAEEILKSLEKTKDLNVKVKKDVVFEKSLFDVKRDNFIDDLKKLDPDSLTPREALDLVYEIKKKSGELND
ncbi:DNA mismatch repair protein MutS [Peptoniphilus duerdenii]|uniref:DNA mismatch repair protein MutS n=1 Tax=Peptoniphilus duerdenii TaxID=507750 RepID=UPI00288AFCAD|nr:DNA mismatch repair protein MutS [Peptoniphilus duerdenii]